MSDKNIVIFDEPASALDPVAEAEQFLHIRGKDGGQNGGSGKPSHWVLQAGG